MYDRGSLPLTNKAIIKLLGQKLMSLFFPKEKAELNDLIEICTNILMSFFDANDTIDHANEEIHDLLISAIPGLLVDPIRYKDIVRKYNLYDSNDIKIKCDYVKSDIRMYKQLMLNTPLGRSELLMQVNIKTLFEKDIFDVFMMRLRKLKIAHTVINVISHVIKQYNVTAGINFHLLILMFDDDEYLINLFRFIGNVIQNNLNILDELKRLHDIMRYFSVDFNFNDISNDKYTKFLYAHCLLSRANDDTIDELKNVYNRILPVMSIMIDKEGYSSMKNMMRIHINAKIDAIMINDIPSINEHLDKLSIFGASGSARGAKIKLHDFTKTEDVTTYIKLNKKQFMNLMPDIDLDAYEKPMLITGSAVKHEVGQKNRQLWNTAVDVYVLMDYVLTYVEKGILNDNVIKLYQSARQLIRWKQKIHDTKGYWLMWDYSDFNIDHSLDIQSMIFAEIGNAIGTKYVEARDYCRACNIVSEMLANTVLRVKDEFIVVFRTLVTGSRHTTFMNTLGNYIYTKHIFSQIGVELNDMLDAIQGDDGAFKCDSYLDAFRRYIAFQVSGYPGTGAKMLFGFNVEFLRIMYCNDLARGCALRAIAAGVVPEYKNEYSNNDIMSMGASINDKERLFRARGLKPIFMNRIFSERSTIAYTNRLTNQTIRLGRIYNNSIAMLRKSQHGGGRVSLNDEIIELKDNNLIDRIQELNKHALHISQNGKYNANVQAVINAYPHLRADNIIAKVCNKLGKHQKYEVLRDKIRSNIYGNQMPSYIKKDNYDEMIQQLIIYETSGVVNEIIKFKKVMTINYDYRDLLMYVRELTLDDLFYFGQEFITEDETYAYVASAFFDIDGTTLKSLLSNNELVHVCLQLYYEQKMSYEKYNQIISNTKYWPINDLIDSYNYFYDDVEINSICSRGFNAIAVRLLYIAPKNYEQIDTLYVAIKIHINKIFGQWYKTI